MRGLHGVDKSSKQSRHLDETEGVTLVLFAGSRGLLQEHFRDRILLGGLSRLVGIFEGELFVLITKGGSTMGQQGPPQ